MDAWEILKARGFVQQHTDADALRGALCGGPVTYYVGFDPTADSLHVGHLLPIMAMAWLQRAGHRPIAVVGGGTAMVGDPSGKTEMRQMLTEEVIAANKVVLRAQLGRFLVLDGERGSMVDNADWLLSLNYIRFLREVGRHFSVNRMLAAEAYKLRLERGLSFLEFNYQILQAYDFLELYRRKGCTLQLGGDDQWGNILAGADLIRRVEGGLAHCLTVPLILTATGEKMGKTASGAVWLAPDRMSSFDYYQYWLNVDDRDVGRFLRLYTFMDLEEISQLEASDIRGTKRVLAHAATTIVHGAAAALAAEEAARAMVSGAASEQLPTHGVSMNALADGIKLYAVLTDVGLAKSRSDARRLIDGGGVRLGLDRIDDSEFVIEQAHLGEAGLVLRVGKKHAIRLCLDS